MASTADRRECAEGKIARNIAVHTRSDIAAGESTIATNLTEQQNASDEAWAPHD